MMGLESFMETVMGFALKKIILTGLELGKTRSKKVREEAK